MRSNPAILAVLISVASLQATAQPLTTAPQPGLWALQWKTLINGRDVGATMKQAMTQMLQALPAANRAQAEAMLMGSAGPMMGGTRQECLTAAAARQITDPRQAVAQMQKNAPQCRFDPAQVSGATVRFKGRCDDPRGFSGDVDGEFTLVGDKQWTGRWGGQGKMAGMGEMAGMMGIAPDGQVKLQMEGGGRWVAADCGAVKPAPR